jgi:hypothetical protein
MAPPTAAKKRKTATATASKKPGWIAWYECEAKIVVLDDLEMGRVSLDKFLVTAEQLQPRYQLQSTGIRQRPIRPFQGTIKRPSAASHQEAE